MGAVIGHQDDRRGWEGAAYGAGAGLLLGTLADRRAERIEAERRLAEAERVRIEPAAAAPVTIINNYYGDAAPTQPDPIPAQADPTPDNDFQPASYDDSNDDWSADDGDSAGDDSSFA